MEDLEKHGENLNLTYITKMIESLLMILEGAYSRCSDLCRNQTDDILANFEHQLNDYLIFHDQHPKRIPMVSYFAKQAGLTHSHFGEAMKEMTSLTAQSYISYKMADYAKEWLMEDKEAREVASMLGFSDSPHFTRFFYAACGELPSDYKKRRTAELENAAEQFNSNEELKKRYEHIDWKQAQKTLQQHEPINEPINSVLCYIRQHGGCKRKDIAEALGMTLISVKRALIGLSEKIEYRGSNKTGGYYAR